jgi:hypothetical protein
MKLKELKAMIDYLVKNYPELLEDYIATEHDVIYLPKPESELETEEFLNIMEQCGFFKEEDSVCGFC